MSWYYANGGERVGPVSDEDFFQLTGSGRIHDDTLVWKQGMADWRPYAEVAPALAIPPTLSRPSGAPGAAVITTSGTSAAVTRAAVFPAKAYGGFWIRFVARLIDGVILWVASQLLGGMLVAALVPDAMRAMTLIRSNPNDVQPEDFIVVLQVLGLIFATSVIVGLLYEIVFLRKTGATPGKMALGLRVERADGSRLSVGRIVGRHFASMLSSLVLCVGYIVAAFDAEKRALHDHLCDTRVVKTR